MDMRQKLLPIFLKEAEINLGMLRQFLQTPQQPVARFDDLEAAFRAAHTLKGTSQLVRADSINSISRRLEAMLEKHFSAKIGPTRVEFEAMQLAVDWLIQLVDAQRDAQPEPKSLVAEALRALDLAECFPGTTPLVELIDSDTEQRSPNLNDPFAADPPLSLDEDEMLRVARDPFADDPDFGLELDASPGDNTAIATISEDPEYTLEIDDSQVAGDEDITDIPQSLGSEAESAVLSEQVPFDPFAEDTSFLENEVVVPEDTIAAVVDPFAEDPSVEDGLEIATVESAEIAQSELQQLDRAKDVAESLLLPKTDEQTRREYVCCAFELCGRSYYLPIKHMVEISDQQPLLPLPLAPAVVKGLINLRGQVIPVIDLSVLHRGPAESVQIRRLVVAEHKKEKLAFLAEGIPYLSEVQVGEKIDLPKFLSKYRIRGAGA